MHKTKIYFFTFLLFFSSLICQSKPRPYRIITLPKSGTHLLWQYFRLIKKHENKYLRNVIPIHPLNDNGYFNSELQRMNNQNVVLMLRDPRDILLSAVFWREKDKIKKGNEKLYKMWCKLSFDEKLMQIIKPTAPFNNSTFLRVSNPKQMDIMIDCLEFPNKYVCRFENLIGNHGGGSDQLQKNEILGLAKFVGIDISQETTSIIAEELFGPPPKQYFNTFRKGQIGEWKNYFTQEHIDAFKKHWNKYLIAFGYETDDDW